jgi:diadenosine tetraphosphate (Ap4A) HIT family hydrolase
VQSCYVCVRNRADDRRPWEQIHVDDQWRLTLAFDTSLPGWLVLVPGRHVEGLHDLDPEEALGMGRLLRTASAALVEATGCERTYVMLFAEKDGFSHLHLHIVPRHQDLPVEHRGPGVFAYLGVPEAEQLPDDARDLLAARLRGALGHESPSTRGT